MKRIFWMLAAAAICITACNKPQYIIPIDDDEDEVKPDDPDSGYKEKTFVVNVEIMKDVETSNWAAHPAEMPGAEILEFFDMTEQEFYKGMGYCDEDGGATGITTQKEATILFGVADENNTESLKWIPKTAANYGHWWSKTGRLTYWQDSANDKYFYTESVVDWGLDSPDAETLADMWTYNIGFLDGGFDGNVGDVYKATEVFFITDDDDVELYAYVQWNIKIVEAQAVSLNVVKTQEIEHTHEFIPSWGATSIQEEIDFDAVAAAIGISADEATVYAINSDGSVYPGAATNFWFSIAGDVMSYGAGCGIDINKDAGYWTYCNYPDETLAGQTLKGAIAFANPSNGNAYVVKVTVNLSTIDYLIINQTVSYEDGESTYTLTENNLAALAAALGVESVTAEEIGTTYPLKGINADDSVFDGAFTANNGYWYTLDGNVSNWGAIEAAGYVGAYIEYRGDYKFGCGMWEESGVQSTVKLGVGDAVLTFNLTVDEPKAFETEEVGTMEASATQAISAGYGGQTIVLDYDAICSTLGLTDEDFEEKFKITSTTGSVDYTAELPGGFWFNADNEICGWGDVDSAYYLNFKYGEALEDASAGKLQLLTGIRNDNSTDAATGDVTHACPPAGTYAGVVRMANIETMKHITLTVTLTITE